MSTKSPLIRSDYQKVRGLMRPGDLIAFSGRGFPSDQIKLVTHSPISHVGVLLQSKVMIAGRPQAGFVNSIIEATSLNGFRGVSVSRMSDRLATYKGEVYWLPLDLARRKKADWEAFYNFLLRQDHKGYDYDLIFRLLLTRIPKVGKMFIDREDFRKVGSFICSQLVAAGLVTANYLTAPHVNPDNTTPADLVAMKMFRKNYYRIDTFNSPTVEISNFNTVDIGGDPSAVEEDSAEAESIAA